MILGYKKLFPWGDPTNFKLKILSGKKKHTIRQDKKNRWISGRKIQHAHGVRTKQYDHFADGECKSTQKIVIEEVDYEKDGNYIYKINVRGAEFIKAFCVKVDDRLLDWKDIVRLAHNDGFETTDDFFRWFIDGFSGKIIHFTDLKY